MKITLIKSDNPDWMFEVYDWNGLFRGYIGFIGNKNNLRNNINSAE